MALPAENRAILDARMLRCTMLQKRVMIFRRTGENVSSGDVETI